MHCGAVDRTDEFFATADSFRKQGSAPQVPSIRRRPWRIRLNGFR